VPYAAVSWFMDKPINWLTPAVMVGSAAIVHLAVDPSAWRSREEKYQRLMSSRSAQAFD
jgi:hypothetical protein